MDEVVVIAFVDEGLDFLLHVLHFNAKDNGYFLVDLSVLFSVASHLFEYILS